MFWPVVAGEFVSGGLVGADPHVPVGGSVVAGDVVFGRQANDPVFLVDPFSDFAPSQWSEVLVAVDVEGADVWRSANQVNFDLYRWTVFGVVGFWSVVAISRFASGFVDSDESDMAGFE